jgi:hypothetical protein
MHGQGLSQRAMAQRLGVSQPTVGRALLLLGLPTRRNSGGSQGELLDLQPAVATEPADVSSAVGGAIEASSTADEPVGKPDSHG